VQFGWGGLGGFHAGCDVEFLKPIYLGDKVTAECVFKSFEGPKKSRFAKETIIDHFDNQYWNQRGDLIARYHWWVVHFARAKAREKKKLADIELPHPWTEQQLLAIEREILEQRRLASWSEEARCGYSLAHKSRLRKPFEAFSPAKTATNKSRSACESGLKRAKRKMALLHLVKSRFATLISSF
jgi:hypothetical protein